MRVGEAEGDPEGDRRRTLANRWESGRQALVREEFRQAVWEASPINPFVMYNVLRTSTFLCQDAVPTYALKSPVFSVSHDLQDVLCTSFYRGLI